MRAGMEGGRQRRYGKQESGRGPPPARTPHPAPGRQLLPAGHMHMDAGHMDTGRIRTAVPQGGRRLEGKPTAGGGERPQGGGKGKALIIAG